MLSVVTMGKVLTNMIDKTYMKLFSEYYVSSRATVVRYCVLTPSVRGSKKIFQPDRTKLNRPCKYFMQHHYIHK